jgi:tetraacyldisaccharide 4'-kinase
MRMPGFWRRDGNAWLAGFLQPIGLIYGFLTLRRMRRNGARLAVPVISIGNFTAGGAGKTPMAIALADMLTARGETPFIITRGYGGREAGPLRVDPARHDAGQIGDEPLLLARSAPVIVSRDRAAGARLALDQGADVILLDDALQNPDLVKDLSIALVDGSFGIGNGLIVPAGPLRAPFDGLLAHVDCVVVIGEDKAGIADLVAGRKPVHAGRLVTGAAAASGFRGAKVVAFSGIALPEKFEASLAAAGAEIAARRRFADHHRFTDRDAKALIALADRHAARLVTTAKDHVRLAGTPLLERLAARADILPVRLEVAPETLDLVYRALDSARNRTRIASAPE